MARARVPYYVPVVFLLIFVNNAFALEIPSVTVTPSIQTPSVQIPTVEASTEQTSGSTSSSSSTSNSANSSSSTSDSTNSTSSTSGSTSSTSSSSTTDEQSSMSTPDLPVQIPQVEVASSAASTAGSSGYNSSVSQNNSAEQSSDTTSSAANSTKQLQILTNKTDSTLDVSTSVVIGNQTIPVNSTDQILQVISTNASNTIEESPSVLLDVSFPSLSNGSEIVGALGLPDNAILASLPSIPTLITTINSGSGQLIFAPLGKLIPGQDIVISIADSIIPEFGGIKELSMQLSEDAVAAGNPPPDEWFTAEVSNKLPDSLPTDGLDSTPVLFVNIQYQFEQDGTGYNWGDPSTHARPPTMTVVLNKDIVEMKKDGNGCPIVDAYTLSSGTWISNGLGEISSESISDEKCQIVIQTQHFSKFAFSLRHINSAHNVGPGLFGLGIVVSGTSADYLVQDKADIVSEPQPTEFTAFAESSEGFDDVSCMKSYSHVLMTGKYTSGEKPLGLVILRMVLLDTTGKILEAGRGTITDVEAHQTKEFHAIARYNGDFDSCSIHVDSAIPKLRN